ncbi:MAG TPA: hypothetical protein VGG97_03650 [Bryobacteraceae bacterium]|jgi:hypothetical protein
MTDSRDRALHFAYFLIGLALPLAGWALWSRNDAESTKDRTDSAHDVTMEDSFPASDPPSSW